MHYNCNALPPTLMVPLGHTIESAANDHLSLTSTLCPFLYFHEHTKADIGGA